MDIVRRAYQLWQENGQPEGKDQEFYYQRHHSHAAIGVRDGAIVQVNIRPFGCLDCWEVVIGEHFRARMDHEGHGRFPYVGGTSYLIVSWKEKEPPDPGLCLCSGTWPGRAV